MSRSVGGVGLCWGVGRVGCVYVCYGHLLGVEVVGSVDVGMYDIWIVRIVGIKDVWRMRMIHVGM